MNRSSIGQKKMGRTFVAKRTHLGKSVLGEQNSNESCVAGNESFGKKSWGHAGSGLEVLDFIMYFDARLIHKS